MTAIRFEEFGEAHLEAAAALLADRHAEHRAAMPLLPASPDFVESIRAELEGGSGVAALQGGDLVGYLVGSHKSDPMGPHVWSGPAGHAMTSSRLVADVYAAAAKRWVEAGISRHFVFAPALESFVEPWHRLSFGSSSALAIRDIDSARARVHPTKRADIVVRRSTPSDLDAVVPLAQALATALRDSPSFGGFPREDDEAVAAEWSDVWEDDGKYTHFVAEREGRVVGHILMYRRPEGDLRVRKDSIDLGNAATLTDERGRGVGLAMTEHVLAWAADAGYGAMTTDWRLTNLPAARFWPRRGFQEVFTRLHRSIP